MTAGHQNQAEGSRMLGSVDFLQIKQLKHLFFFFWIRPLQTRQTGVLHPLQPSFFNLPTELPCFLSGCLYGLKRGLSASECHLNSSDVYTTCFPCKSRVKRKLGGSDTGICSKRCTVPDIHPFIYSFHFFFFLNPGSLFIYFI